MSAPFAAGAPHTDPSRAGLRRRPAHDPSPSTQAAARRRGLRTGQARGGDWTGPERGGGGGRLADSPAGLLRGPALAGGPAYPLRRPPAAGHRVPGPTRTASAVALSLAGVGGERKLACQGRTSRRPRGQAKCRRVAAEVSWRYRL